MDSDSSQLPIPFLFVCCQAGAEATLKSDVLREMPQWRFAFSRPGFVTFKLPDESVPAVPQLKSVFARTFGWSVGHVADDDVNAVCDLVAGNRFQHVHAWPRDPCLPGDRGFLPGPTAETNEIGSRILTEARKRGLATEGAAVNRQVKAGQTVLDCIVVDPKQWWIGQHTASCYGQQWPGGVVSVAMPDPMASRAYLKMDEALQWSRLPVEAGDACVEIGSAPGGSCQRLLELGMRVTGIDPSEMDEAVLKHPNFTHVRKRGSDLRRRDYRDFKWLFADTNVAPKHTLDTVESIVTHDQTNIRGLLLTLKILQWSLVDDLSGYLQRVRSWGYEYVRCRQLAYQRQELCVAAMRSRSMRRPRRPGVVRKHQRKPAGASPSPLR